MRLARTYGPDSLPDGSRSYGLGFLGDDVAELGWEVFEGEHIDRHAQQRLRGAGGGLGKVAWLGVYRSALFMCKISL